LPAIRLADLEDIYEQKARIDTNTRHFVVGQPANNVLLTAARVSGKSSLIKLLLNDYAAHDLRIIQVKKGDLTDLPDIVELIDGRPERFFIFCDDLSFYARDASYKALKVVLQGSLAAPPENVLIYDNSNRRLPIAEILLPRTCKTCLRSRRKSLPGKTNRGKKSLLFEPLRELDFPFFPPTRTGF